jgi:hypothetical protein
LIKKVLCVKCSKMQHPLTKHGAHWHGNFQSSLLQISKAAKHVIFVVIPVHFLPDRRRHFLT